MDDPLRLIAEQHGVFLRREALEAGYDDKAIARMRRMKLWRRIRQGCYVFADVWSTYTPEERHLVLAKAVLRTTPGPVALSHTTAAIAHDIAVWGADLAKVHVTRLDKGAARIERDVVHHVGVCPESDVMEVQGLPVVVPARAVVELGTVTHLESALVSADNALHQELCSPGELHRMFESMAHRPGSHKIHVVLHHMDGRAETPGETRARFLFWRQGLPRPELQYDVYDTDGRFVARVDFAWPEHQVFGEFDGAIKYGRLLKPGQNPGDAVFEEKRREDEVRALTGFRFGRLVWADLSRPGETGHRFRVLLAWAA